MVRYETCLSKYRSPSLRFLTEFPFPSAYSVSFFLRPLNIFLSRLFLCNFSLFFVNVYFLFSGCLKSRTIQNFCSGFASVWLWECIEELQRILNEVNSISEIVDGANMLWMDVLTMFGVLLLRFSLSNSLRSLKGMAVNMIRSYLKGKLIELYA